MSRTVPTPDLIFDPVLVYASFLGGASYQQYDDPPGQAAYVIFVDASGNLYVGGTTNSPAFPVTPGVVESKNTGGSALGFLCKLSPSGQSLTFSTYIDGISSVQAMAVDAVGNIYVAGPALGPGAPAPLPIPAGSTPFQAAPKGSNIGIVELNPDATSVLAATYLGGNAGEFVGGVALEPGNSSSNVYVSGSTYSSDFPTHAALQSASGSSGSNQFVTALNPTLSSAVYSTYLGQNSAAFSRSGPRNIAVDASGDVYVAGWAGSGYPTTAGAIQTSCPSGIGSYCAIVTVLNPAGSALIYSTYLANVMSQANAVAVDAAQNIYVSGQFNSPGFLEVNPISGFPSCGSSAIGAGGFVSKITAAGTASFSTCLNSPLSTLSLDSSGNIYIVGVGDPSLPLTNPIQSNIHGGVTPFIAVLDPNSSKLQFSSFVGGAQQTQIRAENEFLSDVGVDPSGNVYAAGYQPASGDPSALLFPVFNAFQPVPGGTIDCLLLSPEGGLCVEGSNAIVLKVAPTNAGATAVSPALLSFPDVRVGASSSALPLTIFDLGSAALTVSNVSVTGDFSIQNGCSTVSPAGGTCAIQVTFTPTELGTRTGTLTITDSTAGSPRTVELSGVGGTATAALAPTSLTFVTQQPNTTSDSQRITLTNSGAIALQIFDFRTTGPFAETNSCGAMLSVGQQCVINVTFTPTAAGPATGMLFITDSAADSPQTISLSGTGGTPGLGLGVASGGSASATVTAGQTAMYALSIGGQGVSGNATLTCTGAPSGVACNVPATATLSATTPAKLNVQVTTTTRSNLVPMHFPPIPTLWVLAMLTCWMVGKMTLTRPSSRMQWRFAPLVAIAFCACGGGSNNNPSGGEGTQAGSYTLVVTGKSGSITQSQNLTLVVQ